MNNNHKAIKEGIETVEKGLDMLLECVFPYDGVGYLTGVLSKLVQELKHAYRHDYDSNYVSIRGRKADE